MRSTADFCYYWLHRAGHESAIFWAAHVAQFWVLATYYGAQLLIVCNAQSVIAGLNRNPSHDGHALGRAAMDPGSSPG
ncbi:MAG: hypothetical protein K0Q43_5654 [Ramlibacter sp.]|jgi:hypothetical protein|nr:hypothetical protein [Ramlibacter sp.]